MIGTSRAAILTIARTLRSAKNTGGSCLPTHHNRLFLSCHCAPLNRHRSEFARSRSRNRGKTSKSKRGRGDSRGPRPDEAKAHEDRHGTPNPTTTRDAAPDSIEDGGTLKHKLLLEEYVSRQRVSHLCAQLGGKLSTRGHSASSKKQQGLGIQCTQASVIILPLTDPSSSGRTTDPTNIANSPGTFAKTGGVALLSEVDPALDEKRKKERARKFAKITPEGGSDGATAADSALDGEGDRQLGKQDSGGLAIHAKDVAREGKSPKGRTPRQ